MPESDGSPSLKSRRLGQATLTGSYDRFISSEGCVMIGDCVRPQAGLQSNLLSGIGDTDGVAPLPGNISTEELQIWQAASMLGYDPTTKELMTILKVADAVGDTEAPQWTGVLAERVRQHLICEGSDKVEDNSIDIESVLLCLDKCTLSEILDFCLLPKHEKMLTTQHLLGAFHPSLHPAILSHMLREGGGMLCFDEESHNTPWEPPETLLTTLADFDTADSGFKCLTIHQGAAQVLQPANSAALLGRVLDAHPGLSDLRIQCMPLTTAWLNKFSLSLRHGAARHLETLHIEVDAASGGCAALARCAQCLPALKELSVTMPIDDASTAQGGPRLLDTFARPVASPAVLPSLEKLCIDEQRAEDSSSDAPQGSQSCPPNRTSSRLLQLLAVLHLPVLTHLALVSAARDIPYVVLLSCLQQMPSLSSLRLSGQLLDTRWPSFDYVPHLPAPVPRPGTLQLQELTVRSGSPDLPLVLAAEIITQSPLTSLQIDTATYGFNQNFGCAYQRLLRAVACCASLEQLHINMLCGFARISETDELPAALQKLSSLKVLSLRARHRPSSGPYSVLCPPKLAAALRGLSGLQSLSLRSDQVAVLRLQPHAQEVLDACASLQQLTSLELCCHGVQQEQVAALVHMLPALKRLEVSESLFEGSSNGNAAQFTAQFPAVCVGLSAPLLPYIP